jgi:selenocysteine-specific elongation factor
LALALTENAPFPGPELVALKEQVATTLTAYHKTHPLRHGMPREELRSQLELPPYRFDALLRILKAERMLTIKSKWIALPQHKVLFSPFELVKVNHLLDKFAAAPFAPPSVKDARNEVGRELFYRLLESGDLVMVSDDVLFRKAEYETMRAKVCELIETNGQVTAAEVRDIFHTSRKYVLALLEYLDKIGLTVRDGDYHRLGK